MSGHHPFSELIKDFSPEHRRLIAIGSQRLEIKIQISETIGEKLLLENDELSDLLCDSDLDSTDKKLITAIENQLAAIANTPDDLTPAQHRRLAHLTAQVRDWITQAESVQV